jgi:multidrug efflux pump subunit AcrA (membrane-fusion protein)
MRVLRAWRRRCGAGARRALAAIPAPVVVAAALLGAWALDARLRDGGVATSEPACSLRVLTPARSGRLAWIAAASGGEVRAGDLLARLDGAGEDALVRAPAAGRVRAVLGSAGERVEAGDPLIVVEPASSAVCP